MSEPESLATVEGLAAHLRRHRLDRLIMLSDGIFAIAVTLAALEIHMPEHFTTFGDLVHALTRPLLGYFLAFFVTAIFWLSHRNLFARLRQVDGAVTALTLLLLCFVSLIPAMVSGIYQSTHDESGFRLWALTMILCGSVNSAMWIYAASRPRLLVPGAADAELWPRALLPLLMPVMFTLLLIVPPRQAPMLAVPIGLAGAIVRRVVMPRWIERRKARETKAKR